jgi:integrase
MRFHDLRHLHASITQSLGIDDKIRQDMGGWSNPVIMNGTYTEIFRKDRIEADNKVINYFDEIVKRQLKTTAI